MKKDRNLDWILYDLDGNRHAIFVSSWSSPPKVPPKACNLHETVAYPIGYDPCYGEEARAAFIEGYKQAGGDASKLSTWLKMFDPKPKPEETDEW